MVPTKMQYTQAICLMMAAREGIIELDDADKAFIGLILDHGLKGV